MSKHLLKNIKDIILTLTLVMKKIPFIGCLINTVIIGGSTILLTSCSTKANDDDEKLVIITDEPTSIMLGDLGVSFSISAKYDGKDVAIKSCTVNSSNEDVLSASYSDNKINLVTKSVGRAKLTLKVTDVNSHKNTKVTSEIIVSETSLNNITYNNQTIDLANNIDPNMFCVKYDTETKKNYISLVKYDGETLSIFEDDFDKISQIYIKSCDRSVKNIGNNFLAEIPLIDVDFSGLENIEKIGDNFLADINTLKCLDLSNLKNLKTIGANFLYQNKSLEEIKFCDQGYVSSVADNFMFYCTELKSINLSFLNGVESIGNNFLMNATSIETINLDPLYNLTEIKDQFLCGASNISTIDVKALTKVKSIGNNFLAFTSKGPTKLSKIDNLSGLSNVKSIGNKFLARTSITNLDLNPMINLESIGTQFLYWSENMTELKMNSLVNLKTIAGSFCDYLYNLEDIYLPNKDPIPALDSWGKDVSKNLNSLNAYCANETLKTAYSGDEKWNALSKINFIIK